MTLGLKDFRPGALADNVNGRSQPAAPHNTAPRDLALSNFEWFAVWIHLPGCSDR